MLTQAPSPRLGEIPILFPAIRSISFGTILAVVLATTGWSQTKPSADLADASLEELMNIEVESVYGASKHLQKLTQAPASVTIVSSDEIRKNGYRTLADALRNVRGLYV